MIPEIWRRDKPLAATGGLMFVVLIAVLFLATSDTRTLLGLNVWVKPAKFLASVGIYVWSLAWFMPYVSGPSWLKRVVSWGVSISMVIENSVVVTQAARGVRSHFNFDTAFDGGAFAVMGGMIALNTVFLIAFAGMLFWRATASRPRVYLWSIRIGVLLLLAGSVIGNLMISNGAHAVGVADGGPGLRFLNFSTEGGDLRVGHLLGIHGLQAIPLFAFVVRWKAPTLDDARQTRVVWLFSAFYAALMILLFLQANAGRPLVPA